MRPRHFLAAQAWYAISQGAPAFLNPYINLFFARDVGLRPSQIGLLSALRPWISAPCGSILAGLADRWGAHRFLLLFTYIAVTLIQGLMALPPLAGFCALLALTVLASTVYTPSQIIADAAVMAASTHPGDYGRLRTWASVSWTAFAPLAGWVNSRFGIRTGIACYVVGSLLALPAAWMLPVEALRRKVAPIIERGLSKEVLEEAPAPAGASASMAALPELQQPLLAEEAPPTPAGERAGLGKALAIIRFIEAITELGVAPPAGVGLYGYAALPLQYAAHHLAPPPEEGEHLPASPGFSPFAGAQEPGSESPPFESPLSNGAAGAEQGAQAGIGGAGPSRPPPTSPTAALVAAGGRGAAGDEEERAVHCSSLALGSLERAQLPPRPATLPRPISTDNLGRVASLAYGIPGVRTRAQLAAEPAPASTPGTETEEEEGTFSPDSDVVLSPHAVPRSRAAISQPAEEDAAAGAMFAADDLPAGRTASTMLRDVRGIRTAQQVQQAGEKEPSAVGASAGREVSEELPVSVSPPDAEAITMAAPTTAVPTPPAGAVEEPAATPVYRSAALHRLAQIFGGLTGGPSEGGATQGGGLSAAAAAPAEEEEEGDEEAGPLLPEAALPLSPVQKYISYRQGKRLARKEAQRAAAAAEDCEPPPPTPLPASLSGFGGLLGSITPCGLLASSQWEAAQQAAASTPRQLMREAVDQELQDAAEEHDPTGTLIISMLSKKLERMAAEERRQQRLRRRAARKAAAAAAAAADGAAALPPSGPEAAAEGAAGAQRGPAPELKEGCSAVQLGEQAAERPLGFGAALKRLLSNPEVDAFFAITAILGFGHGIIGSFLFMFLAEQDGSEMLMGYVLMANALPELPAFFFFGRILATLGMNTVLLTAAASLGVRIWAYALLPRIGLHWVVVIEGLHAVTYACGWSASAVNSSKIAPPGLESTTQAIFQGLWTGVGCGVAGLLGGVLYGTHGPVLLFQASGLAILGSTALAAAVLVSVRWRHKHHPALLPSGESFDTLPVAGH